MTKYSCNALTLCAMLGIVIGSAAIAYRCRVILIAALALHGIVQLIKELNRSSLRRN